MPFLPYVAALLLAFPALAQSTARPVTQAQIALSFAPVVKQAAPAVVNIFASRIVRGQPSPFAADPFFRDFLDSFGTAPGRIQNSLGSGVIVTPDGIVVSNHHVVEEASEIRVVLNDRREFAATVILADRESDLAVLRLDGAGDLPALAMRDNDAIEVGDLVLAIGNPFGVGQTVSSGIVSGLARSGIAVGDGRGYFIQTDAAINPGNSGGALVDMSGQLVGINTAILTRTGGSNGIGFAIPATLVRSLVAQAQAGATRFQRPWAGVTGQAVDAALAEALGLARPEGVVLNDLHPQSPLRAAGLSPGDVVLALSGQPVNTPEELLFRMAVLGLGQQAVVRYRRNGAEHEADVPLSPPPDLPPRDTRTIQGDVALRGLTVARINPAVADEMDLDGLRREGVVVLAAEDRAAQAGLIPGDILLGINGVPVGSPADVDRAATQRTRLWQVDILRQDQGLRLRFRL